MRHSRNVFFNVQYTLLVQIKDELEKDEGLKKQLDELKNTQLFGGAKKPVSVI